MNDLYTFNKRSNHVQFFKWLWGVDPTVRYKTMCPYFWSYVVTIIILPFLVLIRLFGTWGQEFNGWMLTYRQEQREKKKKEFKLNLESCKSSKEAYKLWTTKCWDDFSWVVDYETKCAVSKLAREYEDELNEKRWAKEDKKREAAKRKRELARTRKVKTEAIKESPVFKYISYGVVGATSLSFLYGLCLFLYALFVTISWSFVFKWVGYVLLAAIGMAAVAAVILAIYRYIIKPFFSWLECRTFDFDCMLTRGIGEGFNYIGIGFKYIGLMFQYIWSYALGPVGRGIVHGFIIFFDTIYKIYKKQCPVITWEE